MDRDQAMRGPAQDKHAFLGHSFNDITTHGLRDAAEGIRVDKDDGPTLIGRDWGIRFFSFFLRSCMPLSALDFLLSTRSWGLVTNDSCTTAYVMFLALIDWQGARCGSR